MELTERLNLAALFIAVLGGYSGYLLSEQFLRYSTLMNAIPGVLAFLIVYLLVGWSMRE
jgi:ABC-type dipeptide/oligopeptide/nickel transport system permease subunit